MTDDGRITGWATEPSSGWPLTPFVRVQLAVLAVWGPPLIGVLVLLPAAALGWLVGGVASHLTDSPISFWVAVAVGALVTARIMPRVWPAAGQVTPARRLLATILGPAATLLFGVGARAMGVIPAKGSMDPIEAAAILAGTLAGASLAWFVLRRQAHE
jgi:hypothetical protein